MMFQRLLIANRGEIACRVARTARRMGLATIAVYSDADADALHVRSCDQAMHLGGAASRDSYLRIDRVLQAARQSGAQAVHPGYGFLSENADFAQQVEEAGLIWVGPPPAAIRAMGSKSRAKALMQACDVPLLPGWHGEAASDAELAGHAARIGYPVLIKASAGGGGRGMRIVHDEASLAENLAAARREAEAAFGDSRILLEKYLTRPRHIEVQVLGDAHGNMLALFERDCSIQRRHQKVIEEAPAPGLDPALRQQLYRAAIAAARAVDYRNAGTIEFIMQDGAFYFMEMNTRMQVEHPVTELITGLDLVEWQLRIAAGEALPFAQADLRVQGHAIEARLCAEDPARDYLPSTGRIRHLHEPAGEGLRIDSGIAQGGQVTPYYDAMLAKIIAHGPTRQDALMRLRAALAGYEIAGVTTNLAQLQDIAASPAFAAAELDTGFLLRHAAGLAAAAPPPPAALALAALLAHQCRCSPQTPAPGPWDLADGFRLGAPAPRRVELTAQGEHLTVLIGRDDIDLGDGAQPFSLTLHAGGAQLRLGGQSHAARYAVQGESIDVFMQGRCHSFALRDVQAHAGAEHHGQNHLSSPIPARIAAIRVAVGDAVTRGQVLLVLEAMKMEIPLTAPRDGVIAALPHGEGAMVREGEDLVELEA